MDHFKFHKSYLHLFFFEKYIFLFSYLEQKELSFTFLNKMWAEAHPSPVVVAFM